MKRERMARTMTHSPLYFLLVIAGAVFAAEGAIMLILPALPDYPAYIMAALDAALLTVVSFPALYFFLLRPMTSYVHSVELASRSLHDSEERFKGICDAAQDAIIMLDETGGVVFWNDLASRIFGYQTHEAEGRPIHSLIIPEPYREAHLKGIEGFQTTGRGPVVGNVTEVEAIRKDGSILPVELSVSAIHIKERWHAVATVRDITERRSAMSRLRDATDALNDTTAQLMQAGKMAAMGEMAAGVAHELSHPLMGIKGFLAAMIEEHNRLLKDRAATESHDLKIWLEGDLSDLNMIYTQAGRMGKTLNNVRDFARAAGTEKSLIDLLKPLDDAFMLFSEQLRVHGITVARRYGQGPLEVLGNPNELQQVFINLLANARDSIDAKGGGGGEIILKSGRSPDGKKVWGEVSDTGVGADAEAVNNFFKPFFTTKSSGKGTGLGLAIVERIVRDHGGEISVECEPGRGCGFIVTLPAADRDPGSGP